MYNPFFVAVHEAGHAVTAILRGIPVARVGLTPGVPGQAGTCDVSDVEPTTVAGWIDRAVVVAAGSVAETMAGGSGALSEGDERNLTACRFWAGHHAPAGFVFPNVFAAARADLSCPVAWAGVVALARRIMACGGLLSGAEAAAAVRTGWRDREVIGRIQAFGPRSVR